MKKYIASWENDSAIFQAKNIKEAKRFAQIYKRRNGIKGITVISSVK